MMLRAILLRAGILATLTIIPVPAAADEVIGPGSMANMSFMLGSWDCSGRTADTGSPFAHTEIRTLVGDRIVISGPALPFDTGSLQNQKRTFRAELWWDASKKLWNVTAAASGFYESATSPGWTGDTLVFVGSLSRIESGIPSQVDYPTYPYRLTMTKVSDTRIEDYDELGKPNGSGWVIQDREVCRKR